MPSISLIQFKNNHQKVLSIIFFCTFAIENKEVYTSATCITFKKGENMKKFLFSMALALGAICMPSQANAAEVSSPVVNNIKATTTFQATPSNGPVVIITKDGTVIIVL